VRTERRAEETVEMRSACAEGTGRNPGEDVPGASVCSRAGGISNPEAQQLLEQIVAPENMRSAWNQVKRNKGAPGVDGRTIDETAIQLRQHWKKDKGASVGWDVSAATGATG